MVGTKVRVLAIRPMPHSGRESNWILRPNCPISNGQAASGRLSHTNDADSPVHNRDDSLESGAGGIWPKRVAAHGASKMARDKRPRQEEMAAVQYGPETA